jgi:chromosome segregation ATPase
VLSPDADRRLVEYGMGNDGSERRSPWDLFAERQVHMRSGDESRYVVLSRPLQIGVAAGLLAVLALLAIASYNAISKHLETVAQQRALAEQRASSAAQAEQSAGELATLRQQSEAAEREIERLSAALDQAQAERMEAITASSEAGAKAAELEGAFVATLQESRRLAAELEAMPDPGGSRSAPGATASEALLAEITGLRAELERVNRETLALRRAANEARQALRALQGGEGPQQALPPDAPGAAPPWLARTAAPAGDEVRELREDLADAQATVATLSADLEALKGAGTGAGLASDAAAELATLEAQLGSAHRRVEQLGASLAGRQPDTAGDAPPAPPAAAPTDIAPLPSPPAPRSPR